ncbi:MAG TPA: hypothetical protein PLV65_07285 [Tenuifilaceae bacterium]|nr:hypothetical protein [Tenuifilaceae bacterium]
MERRVIMVKGLMVLLLLLSPYIGLAQHNPTDFAVKSLSTQNSGMYVLGGWAVTNIAVGAYGWAKYGNSTQYFHQMNLMWNVVNLSIAGFALYNNAQLDVLSMSSSEALDFHRKTERILLINSALDIAYIGSGFLLRHLSSTRANSKDILKGYGNSLILQGGFLLVFDLVLYQTLRLQRLSFTDGISLTANGDAIGLRFSHFF